MTKNHDNGFGCLILIAIGLIIWGIFSISGWIEDNNREKEEKAKYEVIVKVNTDSAYIAFLNKYKNGKYFKKVDSILWKHTLKSSEYTRYILSVPHRIANKDHRSAAKDSILQIENRKWSTDNDAWNRALEINTASSFKKYIKKYPNSKRAEQASKLAIDKEVDNIFEEDYNELPTMHKTSLVKGKTSNISVYNNTSYTLTLLYSGIESKILQLPLQSRGSIVLKNGEYRIAASVDANVKGFAGPQTLTGGSYGVTYYIATSRY